MTRSKLLRIAYKLVFGLLGFSALVTEVATLVERQRFAAGNFFSYFTVETNILAVVVLLLSALALAAGQNDRFDKAGAAVTVYILIVGLGFVVLLSGLKGVEFTAVSWDNIVLHYIMPIVMFVDVVIDRPERKLRLVPSLWWLLFPVVYIIYSLVRGAATGWYPYPFLDPHFKGASYIMVVAAGLLVLAVGLIWLVCKLSGKQQPART